MIVKRNLRLSVLLVISVGLVVFCPLFGQDIQFSEGTLYDIPGSQSTYYLLSGDFNSDSIPDIISFPWGPTPEDIYARILMGVGDGTFHDPIPLVVPPGILAVARADFNTDGNLDFAVIASNLRECFYHDVEIFLGDGEGGFSTPLRYGTPCGPQDLHSADLNGDGNLDLLICGGQLAAYLGNGDGSFGDPIEAFADFAFTCAALGDFDHDGILDAIVGGWPDSLHFFAGNGDGSFLSSVPVPIPAPRPEDGPSPGYFPKYMIAQDLNGDEFLDLVVACENGDRILVYFGQADGSLVLSQQFKSDHPWLIRTADFNADGFTDLAIGSLIGGWPRIVRGIPGGLFCGFEAHVGPLDNSAPGISLEDFNGDGLIDLAAGYSTVGAPPTEPLMVFLNTSDVYVQATIDIKPGSDPNTINLGSNGNVPVAIFSTPSFDATRVDPSSVTLAGASVMLRGKGNWSYSIADVDNDGLMDIVVHVDTTALQLTDSSTEAVLEGRTYEGKKLRSRDSVKVIL